MATTNTTIELNGKLYDARTGKVIQEGVTVTPASVSAAKEVSADNGTSKHADIQPIVKSKPATARTGVQHTKPKLEKSKTLMRPAVKKPQALATTSQPASGKHEVSKKQDHLRQVRASSTPQSSHINRFNPQANHHKIIKKEAPLAVASQSHAQQITGQIAQLATSTEAHVKHSMDAIEESLRNASSHLQTFEDKALRGSLIERIGFKHKVANLASLSFAGLLLVGFFAYQNAPNVEMRLASTRSGVSASMPGYKPAGFSAVRGIKSEPGKVTVAFQSNTSEKNFTVTQQASNWSSDTLLNNHVVASKQSYQTYHDEGKTVFVYNDSNATWVNGGIWYRIDGDASLTSDQLLRIANSF